VAVPTLLNDLLVAFGPSGHEDDATRVWREAAAAFSEVTSDTLGTSFARVRAGSGAPTLAIVGHIDEIGVSITHIEDSGLLAFATVGGIRPDMLLGQRVDLLTRGGRIPGVIGRKLLAPMQARDRPRLELADLHLDIGARSREEAAALVRLGDPGVWRGDPLELANGRLVSKSLDNRLGAYVALEVARRVAEAGDAQVDVVAVAAVQEEIGSYGAGPVAFDLAPLVALAVDVTYTTDVPGGDARTAGKVELDSGTIIGVGPTLNRRVTDLLSDVAEGEGIDHAYEVYTRVTMTDADEIHLARGGVPTALLSIPTRYVHSPTELCSLADVEATIQLAVAFARRLQRDQTFFR
jgi:endoglucanase